MPVQKQSCSHCGKSVMLRLDGTLRLHRHGTQVCDGSWKKP